MNKFIERIALAKLDGTFLKVVTHLERNNLIILDDFGLLPLDMNSRFALLQILEERYDRESMIIVSQLPVDKWYTICFPERRSTPMQLMVIFTAQKYGESSYLVEATFEPGEYAIDLQGSGNAMSTFRIIKPEEGEE